MPPGSSRLRDGWAAVLLFSKNNAALQEYFGEGGGFPLGSSGRFVRIMRDSLIAENKKKNVA